MTTVKPETYALPQASIEQMFKKITKPRVKLTSPLNNSVGNVEQFVGSDRSAELESLVNEAFAKTSDPLSVAVAARLVRDDRSIPPRSLGENKNLFLKIIDDCVRNYSTAGPVKNPGIIEKASAAVVAGVSAVFDLYDDFLRSRDISRQYDREWETLQAMLDIAAERGQDAGDMDWDEDLRREIARRTGNRTEARDDALGFTAYVFALIVDRPRFEHLVPWREITELLAAMDNTADIADFRKDALNELYRIPLFTSPLVQQVFMVMAEREINKLYPLEN